MLWDFFKSFHDFQTRQKWEFSQSQRSTNNQWIRKLIGQWLWFEDLSPKFLLYSHIYLSSIACLTEPDGRVRLATLYQAKMLRKNLDSELKDWDTTNLMKLLLIFALILSFNPFLTRTKTIKNLIWTLWIKKNPIYPYDNIWKEVDYKHPLSALMARNRLIDVMMKILLPACFIALKLTGSFIDFMLGLANSNVQEDLNIVTSQVKDPRIMTHELRFQPHWAILN